MTGPSPDRAMKVTTLATLDEHEAVLLAGRLQAEGVRAIVSIGRSAPGPWSAVPVPSVAGVPNLFQRGTADVLVDANEIDRARDIAARYVGRRRRTVPRPGRYHRRAVTDEAEWMNDALNDFSESVTAIAERMLEAGQDRVTILGMLHSALMHGLHDAGFTDDTE